jgi:hypothetical protein
MGAVGAPEVDSVDNAIIGGTTTTGDPGVVLLFAQTPGSQSGSLCSAEVISPHVILTAAHCVSPVEVGANAVFTVFTGSDFNQATKAQLLAVKETHANALWDPNNLVAGHDVGVAILTNPTTIKPLPYNKSAMVQAMVGQPVRFVGYGISDGTAKTGAGVKRTVSTVLSDFDDVLLSFTDGLHETCNGDSGGPAFMKIAGVETIMGVTSFGDVNCAQGGADTRIDAEIAFIDKYVAMFDPTSDPPPSGTNGSKPSNGSSGTTSPPTSGAPGEPPTNQPPLAEVGQGCQRDDQCSSGACGIGTSGTQVCVAAAANGNNNTIGGCSVAVGGQASPGLALLFVVGIWILLSRGLRRRE